MSAETTGGIGFGNERFLLQRLVHRTLPPWNENRSRARSYNGDAERDQVIEQVLRTISRYNMLPRGARAGVAVSGGADSVALLHLLHRLAPAREWSLAVLHFDHHLRGAESDGDRRFVETLAANLGLPCFAGWADVRVAAQGGNLEQTARHLRYRFFADVRERQALDVVATGHTESDQAETVLMRLLRGASPDSLAGIRAVNDGWIVRPLLELTRGQVREWLRAAGLEWREDSSNTENCYDRNRLRNEVLPLLRSQWNPKVEGALARLAALAARDEEFWQARVEKVWNEAAARNRFGVVLNVERLRLEHPALRARVLMRACDQAAGATLRVNNEQVDRLLSLVSKREGDGRLSLPQLNAWRSFSQILLYKGVAAFPRPEAITLTAPGAAALDSQGPLVRLSRAGNGAGAYNEESSRLDGSRAPGPFCLRAWRAGDRCRLVGDGDERSVHSLLQRRKIPAWDRSGWPVLEWQGQVVWVRGLGVAAGWCAGSGSGNPIEIVEEPAVARD
jgi:tRNA(Ile)-lysidine synthase